MTDTGNGDRRWSDFVKNSIYTTIIFSLGIAVSILALTVIPATKLTTDNTHSVWDMFSFAGILLTVIAFLSAFFILFMAVDAFAASKEIEKNRRELDHNRKSINDHSENLSMINKRINDIDQRSLKTARATYINVLFLEEISSINESLEDLFEKIEFIATKIDARSEIDAIESKGDGSEDTRSFRIKVLSVAVSNNNDIEEKEKRELEASKMALMDAVIEKKRERDSLALMLFDQLGFSKVPKETLNIAKKIIGEEKLRLFGHYNT